MNDPHASTAKPGTTGETHTVASTARFITRSLLVASYDRNDAALLPAGGRDLYRRLLLAAGDRWFVRAAKSRVFRAVFLTAADFLLPGIILHYLVRKRCLEEFLRRACAPDDPAAGGCRQVVVLGAGLDTLPWRWHGERPDLSFVELDRPAALRIKDEAVSTAAPRGRNLTFLPADLGVETLTEALRRSPAFDPAVPTVFLAEGLLMYLPPERVQSLFREIAALAAAGTAHFFAFTFMEACPDGWIGFRHSNPIVDWWLRRQGEPFRWSQSPATLAAFLESVGFTLRELVSDDALRARYLAPAGLPHAPMAEGECLAFAQTNIAP